jgi:hypothetical protein
MAVIALLTIAGLSCGFMLYISRAEKPDRSGVSESDREKNPELNDR